MIIMKKCFIITAVLLTLFNTSQAQDQGGPIDMLQGASEDASTFLNSYFSPIFKGIGYGFNGGWYTTAKPHNPLGLDLSLSFNLAYVPKSDYYFTFRNSDYNKFQLASGTEAKTPTVLGLRESGPSILVKGDPPYDSYVIADFLAPEGAGLKQEIGFNAVPTPVLQLGIGLIKNTDLKIRYVPDLVSDFDGNNVDYSIWGIGLMHDLTQWIPVVDKLPIDISLFASYSSLRTDILMVDSGFPGTNQRIEAKVKGLNVEALVSKKIAVLTVLAGLGYTKATTGFDLLGTYEVTYPNAPPIPGYDPTMTLEDPVQISTKEGSVKLTGGIRLQFAVLELHGTYSFQGYNVLNAGLGLTIR